MARNIITSKSSRVIKFFEKVFLQQKLNNWVGYLLILFIGIVFSYLMARQTLVGMGLFGFIFGMAGVIVCLLNREAGLYLTIIYSFFSFGISRVFFKDTFPVGLVLDLLIFSTFLGLFIQRIDFKQSLNQFTKSSIVIWVLVLLFYLFIELFNPYAKSFEGWYQGFRRIFESVILLFIAFTVFKDLATVKRFIIVLFIASSIVGLYGCIQQWHGLFEAEMEWVMADKVRFGLLFIGGDFRKFSTTSDCGAFGVLMASAGIFFTVIAIAQKKIFYKLILFGGVIFMVLGMAYSGTRSANAMLVAGLGLYAILDFNRKSTRIFSIITTLVIIVIIYGPFYSNATLNRFRSTFESGKDKSYIVRQMNRKFIQPYIYAHPIGAGLGTTGAGGLKYNPGHYLAGFPPDSGYLKKALETGWIGLIIIMILYFAVSKNVIRGYFRSKNKNIKLIYGASTACIFAFYVAEFPSDAIGQITDIVVYYPLVALILKLKYFDEPDKKEIG